MRVGVKQVFAVLTLVLGTLSGGAAVEFAGLRIATYNLENYVSADRMTQAGFRKEYPKPERERPRCAKSCATSRRMCW